MTFWDEPPKITGEGEVSPSEKSTDGGGNYFLKKAPVVNKKGYMLAGRAWEVRKQILGQANRMVGMEEDEN